MSNSNEICVLQQKLIDLVERIDHYDKKYGCNLSEIKGRILSLVDNDDYYWREDENGKMIIAQAQPKISSSMRTYILYQDGIYEWTREFETDVEAATEAWIYAFEHDYLATQIWKLVRLIEVPMAP